MGLVFYVIYVVPHLGGRPDLKNMLIFLSDRYTKGLLEMGKGILEL